MVLFSEFFSPSFSARGSRSTRAQAAGGGLILPAYGI